MIDSDPRRQHGTFADEGAGEWEYCLDYYDEPRVIDPVAEEAERQRRRDEWDAAHNPAGDSR